MHPASPCICIWLFGRRSGSIFLTFTMVNDTAIHSCCVLIRRLAIRYVYLTPTNHCSCPFMFSGRSRICQRWQQKAHQGIHLRRIETKQEIHKNSDILDFSSGCRGASQFPHWCSLIVSLLAVHDIHCSMLRLLILLGFSAKIHCIWQNAQCPCLGRGLPCSGSCSFSCFIDSCFRVQYSVSWSRSWSPCSKSCSALWGSESGLWPSHYCQSPGMNVNLGWISVLGLSLGSLFLSGSGFGCSEFGYQCSQHDPGWCFTLPRSSSYECRAWWLGFWHRFWFLVFVWVSLVRVLL